MPQLTSHLLSNMHHASQLTKSLPFQPTKWGPQRAYTFAQRRQFTETLRPAVQAWGA